MLTLEPRDIDFAEAPSSRAALAHVQRLAVRLSPSTFWRLQTRLAWVRIDRPDVWTIVRPDGSLNLAKLAPADNGAPPRMPPWRQRA